MTFKNSRPSVLALCAGVLAFSALALGANDAHAFISGGLESFIIASGEAESTVGSTTLDATDEETSYGLTGYAMVSALPMLDAGLAIHYLPDLTFKGSDQAIGTEIDYNLRVSFVAPVPAIYLAVHGEAGVTSFSPSSALSSGNDSSNLGYNYGAGFRAGYSVLPTLSLIVGADYQMYDFEVYKGDQLETTTLGGNRIKATFGLALVL